MGETREEISEALRQLHEAGCELITITQYLRPSCASHHPVERWVKPQEFVELKEEAEQIGFSGVMSGPLVRSVVPGRTALRNGHGAAPVRHRVNSRTSPYWPVMADTPRPRPSSLMRTPVGAASPFQEPATRLHVRLTGGSRPGNTNQ
ncbi:Lipoyl synthase, organellar chromatophore [Streptomyces tendae]